MRSSQTQQPRSIAVVGGDSRAHTYDWPEGFDIRHFPVSEVDKLEAALNGGKFAVAIVVVKFCPHTIENVIRRTGIPFKRWELSFNELVKELPSMYPQLEQIDAPTAPRTCNGYGFYIDGKGLIAVEKNHKCEACNVTTAEPYTVVGAQTVPAFDLPGADPETVVTDRSLAYSVALIEHRRAKKRLSDLEKEIEQAREAVSRTEAAIKTTHKELLAAAEEV